jgi:hypothetical protein
MILMFCYKREQGMTVKQVDKFSIMAVMSLISMKSFGCADIKMYEMEFIEMAKSSSKVSLVDAAHEKRTKTPTTLLCSEVLTNNPR